MTGDPAHEGSPSVSLAGNPSITVDRGAALIDICEERGLDVPFNCRAGACGTCCIEVLRGQEHLSPMTDCEEIVLEESGPGHQLRLACQVQVFGPVHIRTVQLED